MYGGASPLNEPTNWKHILREVFTDILISEEDRPLEYAPPVKLISVFATTGNDVAPNPLDIFWKIPLHDIGTCYLSPQSLTPIVNFCQQYITSHPRQSANNPPHEGLDIVVWYEVLGDIYIGNVPWHPDWTLFV